jgi:hypothetical protein
VARAWAQLDVDRLGVLAGDLIGFNPRLAVVALTTPADVPIGRAVWVSLGLDGEQADRIAGSIVEVFDHRDGRRCVAVELIDVGRGGRRRNLRVPFRERVDVLGITDRGGPEARWRGEAFDLSSQGLGAILPTNLRVGTLVLLRFPLPPHRAWFQVRATAMHSTRETAADFRTGFLFERISAGHSQQLHAAIVYLAS